MKVRNENNMLLLVSSPHGGSQVSLAGRSLQSDVPDGLQQLVLSFVVREPDQVLGPGAVADHGDPGTTRTVGLSDGKRRQQGQHCGALSLKRCWSHIIRHVQRYHQLCGYDRALHTVCTHTTGLLPSTRLD